MPETEQTTTEAVETKEEEKTAEELANEQPPKKFGMLHDMRNSYTPATEKKEEPSSTEKKEIETEKSSTTGEESASTETTTQSTESVTLPKLEEMDKEKLIAEYKTLQTKLSEKDNEVKASTTASQKLNDFVKEFKENGIESALKKYGTDFELPNAHEVETYFIGKGKQQSDLGQWQSTELLEKIEQKFGIKPADFEYDPSEAYKADTPSYFYRTQTELKEREFADIRIKKAKERDSYLEAGRKRVETDLETIKKTYFTETEGELFEQKRTEFDNLPMAIKEGKAGPEKDPFSVLNLWRGVNYDWLVERAVDKAVAEVHEEYKKHGLVIKNGKDKPTDVTTMKGEAPTTPVENKGGKHSMLGRMIHNTINTQ